MIQNKKDLEEWLEYELRYYPVSFLKYFLQASENAILRKHQILLRKTEYYVNTNKLIMSLIYKFRLGRIQNKYALHIPLNTCGKGLHIMHVGPVLLNGQVRVGENCSLHINTAIVARGAGGGVPKLGNDCVLGVGAVVLGDTEIADGVAIGANAVVTKSILVNDVAVAGAPARIISQNGKKAWNRPVKNMEL